MRDYTQYSINDMRRYVSAENFGLILDRTNEKYNDAIWRRYAYWGKPSDSKEWIQGQKETPILVRASLLGTHSQKPQRNGEGWKYYGGSILKMGHGFSIDEDDLFKMRDERNITHTPFPILMTEKVETRTKNMIGGIHAELNYVTLQALSTGEIHEFSVDGVKYDYKFPIANDHFISTETGKEWWSVVGGKIVANANADPIQDMLDAQKFLTRDLNLAVDHWKVSLEMFDRLLCNPRLPRPRQLLQSFGREAEARRDSGLHARHGRMDVRRDRQQEPSRRGWYRYPRRTCIRRA